MSPTGAPMCAREIAGAVRGGADAAMIARGAVERSEAAKRLLNAFLDVFAERAPEHARGTARDLPLAGVPVAVKDNICVGPDLREQGDALGYGGRTTCGSRMLENYRSPFTATVVRRLIDAGAVLVGKTNMDEFGMGSSGENSAFGPTRNPIDEVRVPGGSSSGSAAAVAAGVCPVALGSDTGGSIRQPAAFCGLVGVKPTYGRVSRYGLVAYASSLDQIGPIARNVTDAALVLDAICGHDPHDATSARREAGFVRDLERPVENLTLAVPRQARGGANTPAVERSFGAALERFRAMGARIVDVDLPLLEDAVAAYYIIAPAEASSNLARYDGVRYGRRAALKPGEGLRELYVRSRSEGLGAEVRRRIMLGTHVLSAGYHDAYYTTALKVRRALRDSIEAVFSGDSARPACHAILTPTTPGAAFKLGEKSADPMALYLEDVYTVTANLAGLPAMSVPMAPAVIDGRELPLGLQIMAPAFEDGVMLRIARMFEESA
ncbi:MAG TPA: Asp-tRNA(Asn)/Glu-tRNA(Gln) amidotransferase subunit GatA [Phycisphaerales bacterium]|nr:Asp-tRNA(Asn)/Glu-tRNA(Gln) amidotransferase subunit GatA [Phycisphaerales bacterium]